MIRLALILSFAFAVSATAEVYKWKDADGKLHYGDRPSSDVSAIRMKVQDVTVQTEVSESRTETREKLLQSMQEDRLEKKEIREQQKAEARRNRMRCNALRDKLRRLKKASGVYRLDKNGKRVFISNKQRGKSEANIKKRMRKVCR